MIAKVFDENNKRIWSYGHKNNIPQGCTCKGYIKNGLQQKIIDALSFALKQAEGQMQIGENELKLAVSNNRNRMLNSSSVFS